MASEAEIGRAPVTFGELFAGIGGIGLGLKRAGFQCRWQIENDPFATKVLAKHWPDIPRYGDIRDTYGTVDLDGSVKTPYPVLGWDERMAGKLRKMTVASAAEAVKMYEKGLSVGQVAQYFQVSRNGMWDLLRRRTAMRSSLKYGAENHFHRGGKTASDRAQNLLEEAVQRGIIKRKVKCETCGATPVFKDGRTGIQAHHPDYNKPLEIMWLCQKCHHEWHKKNRAIPLEVKRELAPVTTLAGGFP